MRTQENRNQVDKWGWILPLVTALVAGLIAFIVTTLLPKSYRSETTLYFPLAGDQSSMLPGLIANLGKGGPATERGGQVPLLGGIVVSPQVASGPQTAIAMLDSLRVRSWVCDTLSLPQRWRLPRGKAIKRLDDRVSYGIDKNGLLALEAVDNDPRLAAKILNAYIRKLRNLAEELSLNVAKRNRKLLDKQLTKARARENRLRRRLLEVMEQDPNPELAVGAASEAAKALFDLEGERIKAQTDLDAVIAQLEVESQAANFAVRHGEQLPAEAPIARDARARVRRLETEFAMAMVLYGPDHPEYQRRYGELAAAQAQLRAEIQRESRALKEGVSPEILSLRAQRASLEAQTEELNSAIKQIEKQIAAVPRRQLERERLQSEVRYTSELVGNLEMERERAITAEERDPTTFEVVDAPDVPEEPYAPRRLFTTGLSMVAGLLLGVAWRVAQGMMRGGAAQDA